MEYDRFIETRLEPCSCKLTTHPRMFTLPGMCGFTPDFFGY